jgi:hypothetical protein
MNRSKTAIASSLYRTLAVERRQSVPLASGEQLSVKRAPGLRVRCEAGQLWITELDRCDDIVLEAGQSTTLAPVRHTIIRACAKSLVAIDVEPRSLRRVRTLLWSLRPGFLSTRMQVRSAVAQG